MAHSSLTSNIFQYVPDEILFFLFTFRYSLSVSACTVPVHAMTEWGELKYSSIHSHLRHQVEASSQTPATAALPPEK